MRNLISFLFLFLGVLVFSACSTKEKKLPRDIASLQMNNAVEGIWFLQGTSSSRGPYNGELELRKSSDGTYNVVRVVTYINYFYDGLKVQEVWTGKAVAEGNLLTVSYDLKQADFITKLGGQSRDVVEFKNTINVLERFAPSEKGLTTAFTDRKASNYTEWLTTRRDLEARPLWQDERRNIDAKGPRIPVPVRAVIAAFKAKIGYDKDPLVKSYKNRKEFEDERPYIVFDPTDFAFYRENKDVIRVVNKITDDISITEASIKRNAYAPSLEEKQRGYEKNTVDHHINDQGMSAVATVDERGRLVRYENDGDSALWTGMYIGSQAMRYLATKDQAALANVRKSLKGLFILMDITGNKGEFARTLATYVPGQPIPEKWHQGAAPFQNIIWQEGGNNDMVKGIMHGFLWASIVIPESETEIWGHLKEKSARLIDLNVMDDKPQNRPLALGLAALITKQSGFRERYVKAYNSLPVKFSGYSFDTSFYWHGVADWSGINLGIVGDITAITVADRLGETKIRDRLRERLMDSWVTYAPAQRHLVTLAAYGFAYSHGTRGDNFRSDSSDEKFQAALTQAVWGLREIPFPRPNLDIQYDHSLDREWSVSPIPRMFWKAVNKPIPPMEFFYQGLYDYPVFEKAGIDSNFIWKEGAFLYKGGRSKGIEYGGIDYLYGYWLARYSKVPNLN
ncbi:hypothetical protein [Bdellovibrio sp. NC01]|uniref:hypothetical protein n=1 Tax=Bdellovibrio sp. NC01 TaxID=2220073 RepID=UPI00115B8438|nr:hypothetical protein [Bdellovibrio sp. NC01]QDK36173.1 hypothetical protein DOE51_00415 [Bdellovibrio sp. NC01]